MLADARRRLGLVVSRPLETIMGLLLVKCSRFSGLRFSEGYDVLQTAQRSLLCPQAPGTPRLYSLLPYYLTCMCTEIGEKFGFAPKK